MQLLLSGKPVPKIYPAKWLDSILTIVGNKHREDVVLLANPLLANSNAKYSLENRKARIKAILFKNRQRFSIEIYKTGDMITQDLVIADSLIVNREFDNFSNQIAEIADLIIEHVCSNTNKSERASLRSVSSFPSGDHSFYGGRIIEIMQESALLESGLTVDIDPSICGNVSPINKMLVATKTGKMTILDEATFHRNFELA